jgi:hypothetical protein
VSDPEEHVIECGHTLSSRYIALMGILRGYVEADQASVNPILPEHSQKFLLQIAGKAGEATDAYHDVWGEPNVKQLLEGTEFASKLWA